MYTANHRQSYTANAWLALGLVLVICLNDSCMAQLAFHTDANTNSFTLKAPGLQQSFTRYFGGQRGNLLQGTQPTEATAQLTQQQLQQADLYQQTQSNLQYSTASIPQFQYQQQQQQLQQTQSAPQTQYYAQRQVLPNYPQQYQPKYASAVQYQPATPQHSSQLALQQSSQLAPHQSLQQQAYAQSLQQLQLQQQQLLQQQHEQQVQEQLRGAAKYAPQPSQAQTPYYPYQQQATQQDLYAQQYQQQQKDLLRQLYEQSPRLASAVQSQQPQSQGQSKYLTTEEYANYLQTQQEHVFNDQRSQLQEQYTTTSAPTTLSSYTTTPQSYTTTGRTGSKRDGLQYSPSDQVSHVKFSSGNLSYNFRR